MGALLEKGGEVPACAVGAGDGEHGDESWFGGGMGRVAKEPIQVVFVVVVVVVVNVVDVRPANDSLELEAVVEVGERVQGDEPRGNEARCTADGYGSGPRDDRRGHRRGKIV